MSNVIIIGFIFGQSDNFGGLVGVGHKNTFKPADQITRKNPEDLNKRKLA